MSSTTVWLPPAPPAVYLRWMAFSRELERAMHGRPALMRFAADQGAPFAGDDTADFVSGVLATQIIRQAGIAVRLGARRIAPVLEGSPARMARVAALLRRQRAWLWDADAARALGIELLDPVAAELRDAVIGTFESQTASLSRA